jgi:hypothetical protein
MMHDERLGPAPGSRHCASKPANESAAVPSSRCVVMAWFRRVTVVGVLFFLAKGIAWLTLGYVFLKD